MSAEDEMSTKQGRGRRSLDRAVGRFEQSGFDMKEGRALARTVGRAVVHGFDDALRYFLKRTRDLDPPEAASGLLVGLRDVAAVAAPRLDNTRRQADIDRYLAEAGLELVPSILTINLGWGSMAPEARTAPYRAPIYSGAPILEPGDVALLDGAKVVVQAVRPPTTPDGPLMLAIAKQQTKAFHAMFGRQFTLHPDGTHTEGWPEDWPDADGEKV